MPSASFFTRLLHYIAIVISLGFVCLDVSAQTVKYTYDALGRVRVVEDGVNGNRSYDYDAAGNRINVSGPDFEPPSKPSALLVTNLTYNSAVISWTASTDNAGVPGYEYNLNGGTWNPLGSSTSVNLSGLISSTNYTFTLRAKDVGGNYSNPASTSFKTLDYAAPPGIPVNGRITSVSIGATWTASATASATYEWSTNGGASWTATSLTSVTVNGLLPNTGYTLMVRALYGNARSTTSAATFTTLAIDPPSSLRFSNKAATSITASWDPSPTPGATYVYARWAGDAWSSPISATSINLTGLTPNTSYNFMVKALAGGKYSDVIQSTFITEFFPTAAPGTPIINSVSPTGASVSWAPSSTSSATYEWTTDGWLTTASNTGYPYGLNWTLTNLIPSHDYTFQVRAVKDNIKSIASAVTFRTANVGVPGTPSFSNKTSSSVTASWAASPMSGTTYEWSTNGGVSWNSTSSTSAFVGGLASSTAYTFAVRAILSGVRSGASSASFTTLDTVVAAPGSPSFSNKTTSSVTASWAASSTSGATYEWSINGGASWTTTSSTYASVSGLTPYTSYTFSVRAISGSVRSGASSASFTTLSIPLAMVGSLSFSASSTSISLQWAEATGSPGAASYEYSSSINGSWINVGSTRYVSVTGLTPNTSYTFYVRAKNALGTTASISGTKSTMPIPLAAPSGLKCWQNWGPTAWKGQWNAVPGAHHYVFKATNQSEKSVTATDTGSTPIQQSTKPCSWVKACDANNLCGPQAYF